jgi:hypothetical protein
VTSPVLLTPGVYEPRVSENDPVTDQPRDLAIAPCRSECAWSAAGQLQGERLFACDACGSEWVPSEAWTPVDWAGVVPDAVQQERRRQRAGTA